MVLVGYFMVAGGWVGLGWYVGLFGWTCWLEYKLISFSELVG